MPEIRRKYTLLCLCVFIVCSLVSGCATPQKPTPLPSNPSPNRNTSPGPRVDKGPTIAETAERVKRVKRATVVNLEQTAYIALELEQRKNNGTNGSSKVEDKNTVEKAVIQKVQTSFPNIAEVYATTDAEIVSRLKTIAEKISSGAEPDDYSSELKEMQQEMRSSPV